MRLVEIIGRPDPAERSSLVRFVEDMTTVMGARPLSDHLWLDLTAPEGAPNGFVAVRISDPAGTIATAQISTANDASALELIVRPGLPDEEAVLTDLVDTTIDAFRRRGGGRLSWWVDDPTDDTRALATAHDLHPERRLHEMRRLLPAGEHATLATRAFVPGTDDDAWLKVNNRAFATHGEQGGWTHDILAKRLDEPWFDADGFRLHERDGRLVGFCWTKLHHDVAPVMGEIYVIAIDPDFHGEGLGRQLTLAGLDWMTERGITAANLYVDADNVAAVAVYERLGFTVHRSRQVFVGLLDDAPPIL